MAARTLEGKTPAEKILKSLKRRVLDAQPRLAIAQIGDHPASAAYVQRKLAACERIGMGAEHVRFAASVSVGQAEECLHELCLRQDITGVILQLPLPKSLQKHQRRLLEAITPAKDVDGLTAQNLGKLLANDPTGLRPATPTGIIDLLDHYKVAIAGKRAVIVGRSLLVGQPLAALLTQRDATVTVCHSRTKNLASFTKEADILVCATGSPHLIKPAMVKKGAVCVDVGITRTKKGLVGDVHPSVAKTAAALTPVPGGVGPMTVACLLRNCVTAAERQFSG